MRNTFMPTCVSINAKTYSYFTSSRYAPPVLEMGDDCHTYPSRLNSILTQSYKRRAQYANAVPSIRIKAHHSAKVFTAWIAMLSMRAERNRAEKEWTWSCSSCLRKSHELRNITGSHKDFLADSRIFGQMNILVKLGDN